jgi:hypothetical protein
MTLTDDIHALLADDSDFDPEENPRPSPESVARFTDLIDATVLELHPASIPEGNLMTDSCGGFRVEWSRGGREVRLNLRGSPKGRHYIYHEDGDDFGCDYYVRPDRLAHWLRWLVEEETKR